jgi:hypothetical protein
MWLLPRLRYLLARRPYLYWVVAGACAVLLAARLHGVETSAERSAAAWGTARVVWVNDGDTAAGATLHPVARRYPTAMVPRAALASVPPAARAARTVVDGQVLLAADVAGTRTPPIDWVALSIPRDHTPRLVPGDGVAVLQSGALACDGMMIDTQGEQVEIAVPVACAAAVSAELSAIVVARHATSTYGAADDRP